MTLILRLRLDGWMIAGDLPVASVERASIVANNECLCLPTQTLLSGRLLGESHVSEIEVTEVLAFKDQYCHTGSMLLLLPARPFYRPGC